MHAHEMGRAGVALVAEELKTAIRLIQELLAARDAVGQQTTIEGMEQASQRHEAAVAAMRAYLDKMK